MRISDWSSDVCSSDLLRLAHRVIDCPPAIGRWHRERFVRHRRNNIGEHPEICCAARNIDMRSQVAGLASVGDLRVKKVLRTAVDLVGYRNDQLDPFSRCHLAPRSEEHTSELQSLMRISYS